MSPNVYFDSSGRPQAPLNVLLAEDNFVNQKLAVTLLQKRGHRVTVANDGLEAVTLLERETFDVVLMDVHMPNMGGFEATAAIRARESEQGLARVPIVALTAMAMSGDREKCKDAGMDGYLTKPISASDLFAALMQAVAATSSPSGAMRSPVPASRPALDVTQLKCNMDNDEEMLMDIVGAFMRDHINQLRDLYAGLEHGDEEMALRTAHTLKGLLLTLAAQPAAEVAMELEQQVRAHDLAAAAARLPLLQMQLARLLPELHKLKRRAA